MNVDNVLPLIMPKGWKSERMDVTDAHGTMRSWMFAAPRGYRVVVSVDVLEDKKNWLHLSVSRPGSLPSWEDLREAKDLFIGVNKVGIQLFPKQREYINFHPNTLHIWHCLEGPTAPPWG